MVGKMLPLKTYLLRFIGEKRNEVNKNVKDDNGFQYSISKTDSEEENERYSLSDQIANLEEMQKEYPDDAEAILKRNFN